VIIMRKLDLLVFKGGSIGVSSIATRVRKS